VCQDASVLQEKYLRNNDECTSIFTVAAYFVYHSAVASGGPNKENN
jgi:hypothetical protein